MGLKFSQPYADNHIVDLLSGITRVTAVFTTAGVSLSPETNERFRSFFLPPIRFSSLGYLAVTIDFSTKLSFLTENLFDFI